MKKMFLLLLCCPVVLAAHNGITISDYSVRMGTGENPDTLRFDVYWDTLHVSNVWSDTVWVFVDYNDKGEMKRLPLITSGATLTGSSWDEARVDTVAGNYKGVWVVGNARSAGSFSARVQLLTDTAYLAGACVYTLNYPPVGKYTAANKIEFTGTPPFYLQDEGEDCDTLDRTVQGPYTYTLPAGKTYVSFSDASGAPGYLDEVYRGPCTTASDCRDSYCVCGMCMTENAKCHAETYAYLHLMATEPCPDGWSSSDTQCSSLGIPTQYLCRYSGTFQCYGCPNGTPKMISSGWYVGPLTGAVAYYLCYLKVR
jgi:hypothetical protein